MSSFPLVSRCLRAEGGVADCLKGKHGDTHADPENAFRVMSGSLAVQGLIKTQSSTHDFELQT